MYRGFQIRKVNQIINRLKVNLCVTELTCLIFNEVFIHAKRRITFNILKLYYHEPFSNIDDEVNFKDEDPAEADRITTSADNVAFYKTEYDKEGYDYLFHKKKIMLEIL